MSDPRSALPPTDKTLSPASRKVLSLLSKKGCAYNVRGVWRFRGSSNRVYESTLVALLARGLAERIETERCQELRITPAGRMINGHHANGAADPGARPQKSFASRSAS